MTLKDHKLTPGSGERAPKENFEHIFRGMDEGQLIKLRGALDKKLVLDPRMLNMGDELGYQYRAGKNLLDSLDEDTPANQRAQVFNSISAMLDKIVKQQKIVFDAERLKRYEAAWMKVMKSLPELQQKLFFDLYADYLTKPDQPAEEPA